MSRVRATYVDDPAGLGARLKEARRRAGLTQGALAFSGCSAGYISRIEAGERVPSLQILRELARRVGVSESFLIMGRERGQVGPPALVDAEIALRMGDLERASALYDEILGDGVTNAIRAEALEGLGHVANSAGEPREAISLFERALALGGGQPDERPRLVEALGRALAVVGELAPAIALFNRCLERFEREGDVIQHIRFACLLSYALTDTGEFGEAERIMARALDVGREVADPYARARLYWSQSRLLLERGKSDLAERYALKTLEILRATEDEYALGHAYQTLAHIYLDLGRADEAAQTLHEGLPLVATAATPLELAHYQIDQARASAALGRKEEAVELASNAIDRLGEALPVDSGRAYLLLADILRDAGDRTRARELYDLGLTLLEPQGPSRYVIAGYQGLATLLREEGRVEEALDVFERTVQLQQRVGRAA
jgi:tetratricopeptide (TPR) repeat protein